MLRTQMKTLYHWFVPPTKMALNSMCPPMWPSVHQFNAAINMTYASSNRSCCTTQIEGFCTTASRSSSTGHRAICPKHNLVSGRAAVGAGRPFSKHGGPQVVDVAGPNRGAEMRQAQHEILDATRCG